MSHAASASAQQFSHELSAMSSDAAGLLLNRGASPPADERKGGKRKIPDKSERRTKLRDDDSVAKLLFQPWDKSTLPDLEPMDLWKHAKDGDDFVMFHTELAANDASGGPYRVGVGLSRCAGILKKAIAELRSNNVQAILKPDLWAKIDEDAKAIEDALDVLDFGKGSQANTEARVSLRSLRRGPATTATQRTEAEMQQAAVKLHGWLRKPSSPLRAGLSILAGGGLFFAAHAAEKTLRGWVANGATKEDAAAAAIARGTGVGSAAAASGSAAANDAAGLELM